MTQIRLDHDDPRDTPHRRRGRGAVLGAMLALLLVLVGGGYLGYRALAGGSDGDFAGEGSGSVQVAIPQGASLTAIGTALADAGVVKSSSAFVRAAEANPQAATIGPGDYTMRQGMSGEAAVALLLDPAARVSARVALPEGLRLDQSVARLAKGTGLPVTDFDAVLEQPAALGLPAEAKGNAEGFVFPATYQFDPGTSAEDMLKATVARYDQAAQDVGLDAGAARLGYTPYQVLVVASLVQSEGIPADFPKVARVIYNRLEQGMKLQLDATVNYALKTSDLTLSEEQIKVESPYNTYRVQGLPPGPINSPGEAALRAALNPAEGDWLYYVTVDPTSGLTKFTSSYEEFLKYKAEFEANVRNQ